MFYISIFFSWNSYFRVTSDYNRKYKIEAIFIFLFIFVLTYVFMLSRKLFFWRRTILIIVLK